MNPTDLLSITSIWRKLRSMLLKIIQSLTLVFISGFVNISYAVSCYPINTPRMVFSPYQPISFLPQDIETSIDFYCAPAFHGNQLHVSVSVQDSSEIPSYQLRNAFGDTMRFGLFIDPSRSIPLTAHMTIPIRDVNPGARTFGVVLYGRIFANQRTAGVGDYRGFVNLVLDY